jgi:glycosyltransferase involved in cell wall biosynthesis
VLLSQHRTSSGKPPAISVLPVDNYRPFWSVMIPTYNPGAAYLKETLRSVVAQDPGPDEMQIEVVDDCSPQGPPVELVQRIAGDRVAVHRESKNNGLAGIWNRCIERARGEWVHILHQDDFILPGFYDHLRRGAEESDAGAIFCRYAVVNSKGHWTSISELHRESVGLLDDWHEAITAGQPIQCVAIVVRRAVYERLGGYRPQLRYALDWEMWQRIAAHYSFWFEPAILACYREHPASASTSLMLEAADTRDVSSMIDMTMAYHPLQRGMVLARRARTFWAGVAIDNSRRLLVKGQARAARKQVFQALRLSRSWPVLLQFGSFLILRARVAGAKIKRRLRSISSRTTSTQPKAQIESQSSK